MQTHTEVARQSEDQETTDETVDAEFVDSSSIRRQPAGASPETISGPRITMGLEKWLDVDRKLWELYNLVEIAIQQRDQVEEQKSAVEDERELFASRLREWKTYARTLEKRLHAAQIENLELSFVVKNTAQVAKEAVALPAFARRRRRELRERLQNVASELEG